MDASWLRQTDTQSSTIMSDPDVEADLRWEVAEAMNKAESRGMDPEEVKTKTLGYVKGRQIVDRESRSASSSRTQSGDNENE